MKLRQIILFTLLLSMLILSACVTGQAKGGNSKISLDCNEIIRECTIDNDCSATIETTCRNNVLYTTTYTSTCERTQCGNECQLGKPITKRTICENGCENGACIEISGCEEIVQECMVDEDCTGEEAWCTKDGNLEITTYPGFCARAVCGSVCRVGRPTTETIKCTNGCSEGACIEETENECTDTDGGQNPNTQGTITYEGFIANTTSTDYCVNDTTVREFSCGENGWPVWEYHDCEGMCVDGACVEETIGGDNPSEDCRYDIVYIPNQVDVALSYSGTSHTWDETINFYYQLNNNVGWQPICSIAALPSSYYGPTCQQIEYNGQTVNTCVLGVEPNEISNEECLSLWLATYDDYLNLANQDSLDYQGASYDESMMEEGSTYFEYQDLFCEEETNETNNTVECNRDVVYKPGQVENMFAGWGEFIKDSTNTVAFYYLYNYNNYNDYAVNFCQIKTLPIQYEFNDNCYGGYYYDGQEIVVCSSSWTGQETDSQKCYSLFEETYYQDYVDLTQQEQDSFEYRQAIYDASMFIPGSQYLTWEQYFCNQ